jgi:hypothetical protein
MPATAAAAESVRLRATLNPQQHLQDATVGLDVELGDSSAALPTPPTELTVRYPAGLGIELSELGLDTCTAERLESAGPRGCPADSKMGRGSALAEVQIGPRTLLEHAHVSLVRAPEEHGHLAMLVDAEGTQPLLTRILFVGVLLPAKAPFGGALRFTIPPIPSVPGGRDVALVRLHLIIGPPNLVYYERLHGKNIAYHPRGIPLPSACPRGGLPFSATVRFPNGGRASTHTTAPCHAIPRARLARVLRPRPAWSMKTLVSARERRIERLARQPLADRARPAHPILAT